MPIGQVGPGSLGTSGSSGQSGQSGYSGKSGFSGVSGFSGKSGFSGVSGGAGSAGATGASGTSGVSGFSGPTTIPQNAQSDNYTLVLSDSGKHILETGASKTITIPPNSGGGSVAFAIGTAVTFVVTNASGCTIAITTDTLIWAQDGSTGSRTLAQDGIATALKIDTTVWLISGTGLS